MWPCRFGNYVRSEFLELFEWAKCGENGISAIPTLLWAMGSGALANRILSSLFRRFIFRRVPYWEVMLQHLLFLWMVIYSLHFWVMMVKVIKKSVEYCYVETLTGEDADSFTDEELAMRKIMKQWVIWMFGFIPLVVYIQTRPRPDSPQLMIWITTSPWQRREMGPYGYYLNRPLATLQSQTNITARQQTIILRKAYSDSNLMLQQTTQRKEKKRHSKSV